MNLISVENLSKAYGEKIIFDNLTFGIDDTDKIGVIGVNGTGKSTLLKIIAGEEEADSGNVITMNGLRVGYLPQSPVFKKGEVVMDYMIRICKITNADEESKAKTVLTKIGINDFYADVDTLSGGQKKRVAIGAAMISPVDLLILDEPTNHIDSETIAWMENNLKSTTKALLMVTHDRYFLDRVVNKTFELDKGKIYVYQGNYGEFLEQKAQREELAQAGERKRQNFLRTELEWVKRGAKARTTKQKARLQRFETISQIKAPDQKQSVEIAGLSSRLGRKTIEINNVSKAFGDKKLINDFSYIILKNDRIGIVGQNGTGKTTLLKMITGKLQPDSGTIEVGDTVKIGVFSQGTEHMDDNMRVIDYVKEVGEYISTTDGKLSATKLLERFLFNGDMQYSPIGKLSGGEKRRLYLLRVLMSAPNILFLDEPTNDLDIETLAILEDYLDGFAGAVVIISHDRYFLDRCVDRIFAFDGNGNIKQYEGGYSDYKATLEESKKAVVSESKAKESKTWNKGERKLKMSFNEKREFETIDDDIAKLEQAIADTEEQMEKSASQYSKLQELSQQKEDLENQLSEKMDRWMYLNELAEKIENQE
ncbi:MAG: ABC-F family ATP-binding cassette domain-containing protein [Clostridia bacterium]|nr:ABC-F family ATP-binding cassette domain-containing protein [Clostridia bacterium]